MDGLFFLREREHIDVKYDVDFLSPGLCRDGSGDEEGPLFWVQLKVERASRNLWER